MLQTDVVRVGLLLVQDVQVILKGHFRNVCQGCSALPNSRKQSLHRRDRYSSCRVEQDIGVWSIVSSYCGTISRLHLTPL